MEERAKTVYLSNNNHRALNGRESGREREKKKSRPNDINANKNELNNKTNNNFGVIYIYIIAKVRRTLWNDNLKANYVHCMLRLEFHVLAKAFEKNSYEMKIIHINGYNGSMLVRVVVGYTQYANCYSCGLLT